ncbi:MAG: precorrin-6y C5,15-methyltransferase (decarboxylating) subunit CbiE [Polyangiaceae bacterium]
MDDLSVPIVVAGCGPGAPEYVSELVRATVRRAKVIAGAPRLLELFPETSAMRLPFTGSIEIWLDQLAELRDFPIVVLVSGDPGLCSLASPILRRFGRRRCRILPGVSAVQLACARLGIGWEHMALLHAHARLPEWSREALETADPVVILLGASGAEVFAANVARSLSRDCFVCDDLSLAEECIRRIDYDELETLPTHPRRVVVLSREWSKDA